ncbi:guanine nucleotide-binding protein subunit gamma 3-like isoform X2 [Ipomoea triloba]|uniref:guanine nucleotide-binding protein subunit gamma 3-like isoform X2 n=1 Tax=Ipomoea triloba TaxID=35885 RepID=UPI00125D8B57|nr:guanine nucleotide-binding protein subunit gamma 3-like isoform X2 [Ipomoea triloba]
MSGSERGGGVASLPPPQPRSPPLCRRELAKVQVLEREVGFLEDELKFHEGLQPASLLCKEVTNFVLAKPDPLVPITKKASRSSHFWKWLCCSATSCSNISWICCHRCPKIKMSRCFKCRDCNLCCGCSSCIIGCSIPNCHSSCCPCPDSRGCFKKPSCSCSCNCCTPNCCNPKCPSCRCRCCCCPRCPKVNCSNCTKTCCNPCYLCC